MMGSKTMDVRCQARASLYGSKTPEVPVDKSGRHISYIAGHMRVGRIARRTVAGRADRRVRENVRPFGGQDVLDGPISLVYSDIER